MVNHKKQHDKLNENLTKIINIAQQLQVRSCLEQQGCDQLYLAVSNNPALPSETDLFDDLDDAVSAIGFIVRGDADE